MDLDSIEARAAAATPGPWRAEDPYEVQVQDPNWDAHLVRGSTPEGYSVLVSSVHYPKAHFRVPANAAMEHNAAFIAAARSDIPALLAEVKRLRAWLEAIRSESHKRRQAFAGIMAADALSGGRVLANEPDPSPRPPTQSS